MCRQYFIEKLSIAVCWMCILPSFSFFTRGYEKKKVSVIYHLLHKALIFNICSSVKMDKLDLLLQFLHRTIELGFLGHLIWPIGIHLSQLVIINTWKNNRLLRRTTDYSVPQYSDHQQQKKLEMCSHPPTHTPNRQIFFFLYCYPLVPVNQSSFVPVNWSAHCDLWFAHIGVLTKNLNSRIMSGVLNYYYSLLFC